MTLPELRAELRDALEAAGVPAIAGEPGRVSPPVALIGPGSPYLEASGPFGARTVRLRVRLVVQPGETALPDLEAMLERAVPAIEGASETAGRPEGWDVTEASEPYTLVIGTAGLPALEITTTTTTNDF